MRRESLLLSAALVLVPAFAPADVSRTADRTALFLVHTSARGELRTRVIAVDLSLRRVIWERETRDTFEVRVPRLGGLLFFPHGREGRLECLNAATGRVAWELRLDPFRMATPIDARTVLIGGRNDRVTCVRRTATGFETVWSVRIPDQEARELLVAGNRIVIPTYREVWCIRLSDGGRVWRHVPAGGASCTYAMLLSGGRVISWDWWGARVEALSLETGEVLWAQAAAAPWVFGEARGRLLLRSGEGGRLRAVEPANGREVWGSTGLAPQVGLGGTSDDLAYMPFVGPILLEGDAWFVSADRSQALQTDTGSGVVRARRVFAQPLVGAAPAGRFHCFAEAGLLHFVPPEGRGGWTLELSEPILHLRHLLRP